MVRCSTDYLNCGVNWLWVWAHWVCVKTNCDRNAIGNITEMFTSRLMGMQPHMNVDKIDTLQETGDIVIINKTTVHTNKRAYIDVHVLTI